MGIFKSSGHMQAWTGKHIGEEIVSIKMIGDTLFAGTSKGVLLSKDGGENWKYVHKGGPVHELITADKIIFALYESGDIMMSENRGSVWNNITYSPSKQSFIYDMVNVDDNDLMSNHYGIFRSKNGGMDWLLICPEKKYRLIDMVADDHVAYGAARSE